MQPLDSSITVDELKEALAKFGPVSVCRIVADGHGTKKAFGFAYMETDEGLQAVLNAKEGFQAGSAVKPVMAHLYVQRGPRTKPRTVDKHYPNSSSVYISNLPSYVTSDADLADMFAQFGQISSTALKQVCLGFA